VKKRSRKFYPQKIPTNIIEESTTKKTPKQGKLERQPEKKRVGSVVATSTATQNPRQNPFVLANYGRV